MRIQGKRARGGSSHHRSVGWDTAARWLGAGDAARLRQGFAIPLVVPPNVRHVESIRAAADSARDAGLWAVEAFACLPESFRDGLCGATSIGGEPPPFARGFLAPRIDDCDPSYPDVCIPPPPPDLDCGDISHRRFRVQGRDPHRFDGDRDGIGCEGR